MILIEKIVLHGEAGQKWSRSFTSAIIGTVGHTATSRRLVFRTYALRKPPLTAKRVAVYVRLWHKADITHRL